MRREGFYTTGSEIDPTKPFKLPFLPGERVRHLADGEIAIVCTIVVMPHGCLIECTSNESHGVWHFAIESIGDDCSQECREVWEFPYGWGEKLAHRLNGKVGIVSGYRISERGMCVRMAWSDESWEWHPFCELEEPQ